MSHGLFCHNIEIIKMDPHPQKCSSGAIQDVENNGPHFGGSKMEICSWKKCLFCFNYPAVYTYQTGGLKHPV